MVFYKSWNLPFYWYIEINPNGNSWNKSKARIAEYRK